MLLGATKNIPPQKIDEEFIVQLMLQSRYAEAYLLLKQYPITEASSHFNLALCLFHTKNYPQAIAYLDRAQQLIPSGVQDAQKVSDALYTVIQRFQNQTDDHLQALTKKYVSGFSSTFRDHIIRVKTDCWLKLENWQKLVETAKPIEHKNYRNVSDALRIAIPKLSSL